jgi:glucose/arabinose dehydrogenase
MRFRLRPSRTGGVASIGAGLALTGALFAGCSTELHSATAGPSGDATVVTGTDVDPATTEPTVTEPPVTAAAPEASTTDAPPASPLPASTAPVPATTVADPPPPADQVRGQAVTLEPWVDLPLLTSMATRPADGVAYLTSQRGEVWRALDGSEPELVLDLDGVVSPYEPGSERGLLGMAFGPTDDRLYLSYTDDQIDSHVVSYALDDAGHPVPESVVEVLFVDQPGLGHKGGGLVVDPDGTLYVTFGDGGASNGRDAQDMATMLGGIVRIVPRGSSPGYDVPPDNPFVGVAGAPPELWSKGLRNPWGFCRDEATGALWLGDVGNNTMEEINRLDAGHGGANFGWPHWEGTEAMRSGGPADAVPPVHAYRHDEVGPAVIGGCVYRGTALAGLRGAYLFGDLSGPLFAVVAGDEVVELEPRVPGVITGFGTFADGEMAVLTLQDGAFRIVPGT